MQLTESQRWIHRVNTSAIVLLLISGTLHNLPDLRSSLFGGYDAWVADFHIWTGVLFISFPALILARTKGALLRNLRVRIFKDPAWHWRRVHLILTLCACSTQATAGIMLLLDIDVPLNITLADALFMVHRTGAWYFGLSLPLHLWMARRAITRTLRSWVT